MPFLCVFCDYRVELNLGVHDKAKGNLQIKRKFSIILLCSLLFAIAAQRLPHQNAGFHVSNPTTRFLNFLPITPFQFWAE